MNLIRYVNLTLAAVDIPAEGHSMAWIRAAYQARLGAPAFRLVAGGHVTGTVDPSGDIVELITKGHVLDGCALLSRS
ncbi:hypothetical protein [Kribbella sp. NPDC004536]|uniref:hypothetical protein n=1 Tax=Kribbella sp. NPDC004536 TaxID=3364106 RepID=UPI0036ADA8E4